LTQSYVVTVSKKFLRCLKSAKSVLNTAFNTCELEANKHSCQTTAYKISTLNL